MNIHPIFVHFPVALLTLYCIAECLRFNIITRQLHWFYIKAVLVIVGVAAAIVTAATGEAAEELNVVSQPHQHIEAHSTMATITIIIFSCIALCYIIAWINRDNVAFFKSWTEKYPLVRKINNGANTIINSPIIIVVALIGLVAITITGTLGGAMVYGPNNDLVTKIITPFFFK